MLSLLLEENLAAQPIQTDAEQANSAVRLPLQGEREHQPVLQQHATNGKYIPEAHSPRMISEQNPELLHWRANVLLDEMMLGAIDLAANDSVPARALSQRQYGYGSASGDKVGGVNGDARRNSGHQVDSSPSVYERPAANSSVNPNRLPSERAYSADTDNAAGFDGPLDGRLPHERQPSANSSDGLPTREDRPDNLRQWQPSTGDSGDYPAIAQSRQGSSSNSGNKGASQKGASRAGSTPSTRVGEHPQAANGTEQWLFAAEQRYEQIAARRQATQGLSATEAGYEYDGWSMAAAPTTQPDYSVSAAPYSRENNHEQIPSYGTSTVVLPATATSSSTSLNGGGGSSGVVPNGAASKSGRKSLRSNLLPRMNALDSSTVQQEMAMLQNAIEGVLPVGHESRTRAQHLLQKAYTLVQTDPTRSAEVDYYLQQVRTIMQRAQETVHWSNLYQNRLRTYLFAWLALSTIVILSRYLYAIPLSQWLARMSDQSNNNLWVYNVLTITSAFFFGALGGGVGALFTMVQHARLGRGFFDRKYGLRGLILPLIGALFGLGLCVLFGILYAILGVDPGSNLWFGLLPALLALAAGASQEYLYGTRES